MTYCLKTGMGILLSFFYFFIFFFFFANNMHMYVNGTNLIEKIKNKNKNTLYLGLVLS